MKYLGLGALIIIVAAGAIWRFYPSKSLQPQKPVVPPAPAPSASAPSGMVYIPGGSFEMGRNNAPNPEETPAHSVTVAPFYIDKEPVTVDQYRTFLGKNLGLANYPASQAAWPATGAAWQDAQAYCATVTPGGRLPSEAEWEFAARGTDSRLYPWGDSFNPTLVNSLEAGLDHPEPVGTRPNNASPFGVLDMSGNVWQWCADGYKPYPGQTPAFAIPQDAKVIRGGSYKSDKEHVTATARNLDHASTRSPTIGFRCAKSP
jgi:formylglycine-generating enzyme required for sulfatase activity